MKKSLVLISAFHTSTFAGLLVACSLAAAQQAASDSAILVNTDNFVRAETDLYKAQQVKDGGFSKFNHWRDFANTDKQSVVRSNRDTLYSSAVFDLDAGPVTITLPDAGERFMSLQVISQDHYSPQVIYKSGKYTFDKQSVGTRYVTFAVRTFANPNDKTDLAAANKLQDQITAEQAKTGKFEIPNWDQASQAKTRKALLQLNEGLPDTNKMFGTKEQVDPIRHLIGAASGWGGNPEKEATYLNVTPEKNDGKTIYTLEIGEVPVDGFWSISVYNADGYFDKNSQDAYAINNVTSKKDADGKVTIQFGGCDDNVQNCLPIANGWNYLVRLYRPQQAVLDGSWQFPKPTVK